MGGDDYNYVKENYLNTISNLTLSGNNGKLGNKPFIAKRDLEDAGYKDSRLWLNKHLAGLDKWDKVEIENRFEILSKRFLEIWQYPEIELEDTEDMSEVNIFEAEDPKFKKLDYAIFFDQKIDVREVSKLYLEIFKQLFDLQPETFFTTDLAERITLTKEPKDGCPRQALPLTDTYFIEGNIDNIGKFDKIKHALKIFGFEEELTIKYSEN